MTTKISRVRAALAAGALAATAVVTVTAAAGPADAAARVTQCGNHALSITASREDGATGHADFVIRYRNIVQHTCSIHGYPGLDAIGRYGHVQAHAKRRLHGFTGGAYSIPTVILHPGGKASAQVEWMNFNPVTSGACTFSATVKTTPANTTHTVTLRRSVSLCDLQVHPTVAGWSGNG